MAAVFLEGGFVTETRTVATVLMNKNAVSVFASPFQYIVSQNELRTYPPSALRSFHNKYPNQMTLPSRLKYYPLESILRFFCTNVRVFVKQQNNLS